jgi:hypothetical protein
LFPWLSYTLKSPYGMLFLASESDEPSGRRSKNGLRLRGEVPVGVAAPRPETEGHEEGPRLFRPGPRIRRPRSYLPNAEAAWLTCWSHVVEFSGPTSMVAPESSNSKSSASEPYWRTPFSFGCLLVVCSTSVLMDWITARVEPPTQTES